MRKTIDGTAGLVKNYSYDTLIIGSSMTQNFNMDVFRSELGAEPLHIGIGGLTLEETVDLIKLGEKAGRAKSYYICIDNVSFSKANTFSSQIPDYLYKDDILSRAKYLLSYEAWFRFIPVDIGISCMKAAGKDFSEKIKYSTSIDYLENWSLDYEFGREVVIRNYLGSKYSVSPVNTENLYGRMVERVDEFIDSVDFSSGASYNFFFPPYSSLFWCDAEKYGYFNEYIDSKQYFVEKITEKGGTVYDFQSEDYTMDLDHYKDTTHYSPDINDRMVKCFADKASIATPENYAQFREKLEMNTRNFRNENPELFTE